MAEKRFVSALGVEETWQDARAHTGLGPHSLHLPAEPQRLRHALDLLGKLVDELQRSRAALDEAAGDSDVHGDTAHSLQRVVRFSRFTARRDAELLDELAQAVQHLVDELTQVRGSEMEQLRSRWESAQVELVAAAKSAHQSHPRQLLASIDADLTDEYRPMFRRLHGSLPGEGGGGAMLVAADTELDQEIRRYKHTARAVLEEFQQAVHRVRQAERSVRAHLSWEPREKRQPEDVHGGQQQHEIEPTGISGPKVLHRLRAALDDGADVLENAIPQLRPIARSIDDGMLPDHGDDDTDRRDFRHEWEQHLQRRVKRMRFVSKTSDKMANALAKLDRETANEIFKDQDDD